jgi:hypothetical protein
MMAMQERALTPRQERFAQLVAGGTMSQADAYREAYPASKGWKSAESVHVNAAQLAADTKVRIRIEELQQAAADQAGLDAQKVIAEVRKLAHSDIGSVMHPDGRVKLPHELDPSTRAAVKKFKIDELGRIEYEFWPKNDALDKAMRYLGLYERDNNQQAGGLTRLRDLLRGQVVGANPTAARADDDDDVVDV